MVDGINLDEIKEFAKAFKLRRLSLGLTQTQVGQALSVTEGPAYSQSAICRFVSPNFIQKTLAFFSQVRTLPHLYPVWLLCILLSLAFLFILLSP